MGIQRRPSRTRQLSRRLPPGWRSWPAATAAVLPANVKQIQQILALARRYKLALWPVSTGRNLGYGGAAPLQAGAVMLDLQRMKRVLEVNEQHAYAVVEPGVSYLDLHRHLQKSGSRLWLDPTASGWGGPLANFLERGVGYTPYGQHSDTQCGMQLLLADGTLVETASAEAKTRSLYRYGHRAWVDGLFNQANFGIVTRIGVHLMPAPAGYRPYLVFIHKRPAWPFMDPGTKKCDFSFPPQATTSVVNCAGASLHRISSHPFFWMETI